MMRRVLHSCQDEARLNDGSSSYPTTAPSSSPGRHCFQAPWALLMVCLLQAFHGRKRLSYYYVSSLPFLLVSALCVCSIARSSYAASSGSLLQHSREIPDTPTKRFALDWTGEHAPEHVSFAPPPTVFGRFLLSYSSSSSSSEFTSVFVSLSNTASLMLGILFTTFGSSLMAFGSTLMKLGLHLEAQKQQRYVTYPCWEPTWWSGLGGYAVGAALHIVALAFAPASVLAPMNSIGLIANAVAAATTLQEQFGWTEVVSTAGTVVGVALCAIASFLPHEDSSSNAAYEAHRFTGLWSWRDPWYLCYLAVCIACGFAALIYVNAEETKVLENRDLLLEDKRVELKNMHGVGVPGPKEDVPETEQQLPESSWIDGSAAGVPKYPKGIGVSYGFLAGLVGAQCVLQVKEIVCSVQYSVDHPELWNSPQPYLGVVFLLLAVWLQIHFLNLGLARGDATVVVPTYYVFWTFFGTFGGFAKFHEVEGFSALAVALFSIGFALTIACIAILAVQEMINLRKFVDERVPDMPEEQMDLATQEMQDKQLGSQVTLAMGLFPFSMLGRTVGRKRFRPLYQRFRRTRSTASDTALGDAHGEYTIGPHSEMAPPYTLPHCLHLYREQHSGDGVGRQMNTPHSSFFRSAPSCSSPPPIRPANRQSFPAGQVQMVATETSPLREPLFEI